MDLGFPFGVLLKPQQEGGTNSKKDKPSWLHLQFSPVELFGARAEAGTVIVFDSRRIWLLGRVDSFTALGPPVPSLTPFLVPLVK